MTLLRTVCSLFFTALVLAAPLRAESEVSPQLNRGEFGPLVRSLNNKPYGYSVIEDASGNAPARFLERFEVRNGDCYHNKGGDDCTRDRERSELSEQGARNAAGSSAWYGWDFYLSADWPDVWPTKTTIAQFHQERDHPVWMFLHYKGRLVLDDHTSGKSSRKIDLISESELRGKWHRIVVHANWATDATGSFEVWVDGEKKFDMSGPTMTAKSVYFKYGVYRAFVSRYKIDSGSARVPTQIALFANVRKSATREGLK